MDQAVEEGDHPGEQPRRLHPGRSRQWLGVSRPFKVGSPITWDGEYDGRSYQDKGEVLTYDETHVLSVTHYSPIMGQPDEPESYRTLVYTLRMAVTPRSRQRISARTGRGCWVD
jgi:hypothetical protein